MQSDEYLKTKCTILAISILIGDIMMLSLLSWNTFLFVTFTSFTFIVFSIAAFLSYRKKNKINTTPPIRPVEIVETVDTESEKQIPDNIGPPPSYNDIKSHEYI